MKDVLELLDEIEDILETSAPVMFSNQVRIVPEEILDIIKDIRLQLPDEIQQARWIKEERQRILEKTDEECQEKLEDAKKQAEVLIENSDIVVQSKRRAAELMAVTEENCRQLKLRTYEYVDSILYNMQQKVEELNSVHFTDMFNKIGSTFEEVGATLNSNRAEIKDLSYKTQMGREDEI
ncbi:MAG: ATPase [Eubacteriales bacterium]